jgi:hypothetical protein
MPRDFRLMDNQELLAYFSDAQQAYGFITPQQLRIEAEVYQTVYGPFDYAGLIPVDTDGDMWDAGTIYYSGDIAGKAEFFSGRAFDMPFADVSTSIFERANHMAGVGYEYSTGELIRAARTGRNLTAEKADAARRVSEQFIYNIVISGNTEKSFVGLINNAAVPNVNTAAWGATPTITTVLGDVNAVLLAPYNATRGRYTSDILLMPPTAIQLLAGLIVPNTNITFLDFVRTQNAISTINGNPLEIRSLFELETAGAGATRRMVAYARDRNVAQFHLPGPHTFLPPFQKSMLSYEIGGLMNIGGTEFRIPTGAAYRSQF